MFCLEFSFRKNLTGAMKSTLTSRTMNSVHYWNVNNTGKLQVSFPKMASDLGDIIRIFASDISDIIAFQDKMPRDLGRLANFVTVSQVEIPLRPAGYVGYFRLRPKHSNSRLRRQMKRRQQRGEVETTPDNVETPTSDKPFFMAHSASMGQSYPILIGSKSGDITHNRTFNPTGYGLTTEEDCYFLPIW